MLETLKEMLDVEPFRPFRIIVTSGSTYDVIDPHSVTIGRSEAFYCFPKSDRFVHIRLNQIAALASLSTAA